jgi:hypothetical protein
MSNISHLNSSPLPFSFLLPTHILGIGLIGNIFVFYLKFTQVERNITAILVRLCYGKNYKLKVNGPIAELYSQKFLLATQNHRQNSTKNAQ